LVCHFAGQSTAQRCDGVIQPTKSVSHPTSHGAAVHHHSQSPVAHTLQFNSIDTLDVPVSDSTRTSAELWTPLSDSKRKPDHHFDKNDIATLPSLHTKAKYDDIVRRIDDDNSERVPTRQFSGGTSVTSGCAVGQAHLSSDDKSVGHTADIVSGNNSDVQGMSASSFV